jgi:rhomboid family GlyGly-CTERM serine protease
MKLTRTDAGSQSWSRSANCDGRYGLALLATLLVLLAFCAGGDRARELLRYEREPLAQLQWWRLIGAHFVHLSLKHTLLNCAGLTFLWMLFAREFTPRRWLWILCCAAAAIDAGLWFLRPEVSWYLGASGVLHGALAAGAVAWYRRGHGLGAALLLLLIMKLIYERNTGSGVFAVDLPLMPDAHLFGALGGLIGASLPRPAAKPL